MESTDPTVKSGYPFLLARVPELMDGAWDSPFDRDRKTQPQAPSAVTLSGMLAQAGSRRNLS